MKIRAFIFISTIFFISCTKETSIENGTNPTTPPPPPVPTLGKLVKLIWLDTLRPHPSDTALVQYFSYDANQRVTKIAGWQQRFGILEENEIVKYFYNSNDTLSNHASYTYFYPTTPALDSAFSNIYYTYNASRQLIKDSTYDTGLAASSNNTQINYLVYDYTNQPNGFLQQSTFYSNNSTPNIFTNAVKYTEAKNGINVISRIAEDVVNNTKIEEQLFYDTALNPIFKSRPVNDRLTGNNTSPLQFVPDNREPARNNITKIITKTYELSSGTLQSTTTRDITYEYNAAGQPVVMRVKTNDPVNAAFYNKYIFVYQ